MEKLFRVYSKKDVLESNSVYFNDVEFAWFAVDRIKHVVPYNNGIKNYDKGLKGIKYTEKTLDELFTKDEADKLCKYLENKFDMQCQMKEVEIPIENDRIGLEELASEAGIKCCLLSNKNGYNLPFNVSGYCDLRDLNSVRIPLPMHKIRKLYRIDDLIIYELHEGGFGWADFGAWREHDSWGRFYIYMHHGECVVENNLLHFDRERSKEIKIRNKTFDEIYQYIDTIPKWDKTDYYVEIDSVGVTFNGANELINSLKYCNENKQVPREEATKIINQSKLVGKYGNS